MEIILSIVTPVMNGERFIRKNIESIMKLTTPHEHIIVDGGSSDNTLQILREYSHLKVLYQKDHNGMYGGIKLGFDIAKGEFISWINCDDYPLASDYDCMINKMIKKNADFIYSDSYFYYEKSNSYKRIRSSVLPKYFLRHGIMPFTQPSTIYRKSLYEKYCLNPKYRIVGDMDLFFRMSKDKLSMFKRFRKPTVVFLKYGESLGDKNTDVSFMERKQAGIPFPNIITRILFFIVRKL